MTETTLPHLTPVGVPAESLELGFVTVFGLIVDKQLEDDSSAMVGFRTALGKNWHFFPPEAPIVVYGDIGVSNAMAVLQMELIMRREKDQP